MQVQAFTKSVRISPRKISIVADSIRHMKADEALAALTFTNKRGATVLSKTLASAVANAVNNNNLTRENLRIARIEVTPAQALKRYHPSTRGRIHPYKRRGSHVTVVVEEKEQAVVVKKTTEEKGNK